MNENKLKMKECGIVNHFKWNEYTIDSVVNKTNIYSNHAYRTAVYNTQLSISKLKSHPNELF